MDETFKNHRVTKAQNPYNIFSYADTLDIIFLFTFCSETLDIIIFIYILFRHIGYYFFIYILFRHFGYYFFIYILFGLLSRFIYRNGPSSFIWSPNQPFRQHFFSSVVVSGVPKLTHFTFIFVPKRKIPCVQTIYLFGYKNQTRFTLFLYLKGKRVSVSNSPSIQFVLFRNNF
jgi:hypothetical protein